MLARIKPEIVRTYGGEVFPVAEKELIIVSGDGKVPWYSGNMREKRIHVVKEVVMQLLEVGWRITEYI